MSTTNIANPGLVNVADQSDGPILLDQSVGYSPSQSAVPTARGLAYAGGTVSRDQTVTVAPSSNAGQNVDGGLYSPEGPVVTEVTFNNVAGQVYGTGTPANVFV